MARPTRKPAPVVKGEASINKLWGSSASTSAEPPQPGLCQICRLGYHELGDCPQVSRRINPIDKSYDAMQGTCPPLIPTKTESCVEAEVKAAAAAAAAAAEQKDNMRGEDTARGYFWATSVATGTGNGPEAGQQLSGSGETMHDGAEADASSIANKKVVVDKVPGDKQDRSGWLIEFD